MSENTAPLIRLDGISKAFGRVQANRQISLDIRPGRIKALLGENGAGKSTLMSILSGRLRPDAGRIFIGAEPHAELSTRQAIAAGIGMVYQHFMLVEAMTVAENIFLGLQERRILSPRRMNREVAALAERYGLAIDPGARIDSLSMGERQRVEILKLLKRDSRVLIFDEPTAVLTPPEIEQLFSAMKQMTAQQKAVVFISHKLTEVMTVADEIAILRKGAVVDQMAASAVGSKADLARRMVGREVLLRVDRQPLEPRQTVLRVRDLSDKILKNIDFSLRQGEILAVVGVAGNGQKRLVETICGLRRPSAGSVSLLGMDWGPFFARRRWEAALSYIPEDRQRLATCANLDLTDNFLLTTREGFCRGPWLDRARAAKKAAELVRQFNVQPVDVTVQARQLSGGNLQKMVLAREFFRRPRLIVAEQPSQGLDIGATEEVWSLLLKARDQAGVLLITGDIKEAVTLSDRIAVMYGGRIMDLFDTEDEHRLSRLGEKMAGIPA
jgi:simple sugar transport system ATP-binding protein